MGGTLVWIKGDGEDSLRYGKRNAYRCRFRGVTVVASYDVKESAIVCRTPAQPELGFNTSKLDDEKVLDAAARHFYDKPPPSPPPGAPPPLLPGNVSNASSAGISRAAAAEETASLLESWSSCELANVSDTLPKLDQWLRVAVREFNETHEIRCTLSADDALAASVPLQVSLNGQDFTPIGSGRFEYLAAIQPEYLEPPTGPSLGGRHVAVRGTNFTPGVPYECRFGVQVVPASRVHSSELVCAAPPSTRTGASDSMRLDLADPWLLTHGSALQAVQHKLLPLTKAEEVEVYVPPEVMRLTSFRIAEEPAADTTAGVPFAGVLRVELLDQRGSLYRTGTHRVVLSLGYDINTTMAPGAVLIAEPQPEQIWCGSAMGGWCGSNVAQTRSGVATFRGLRLDTIGGGLKFDVTLSPLNQVQRTRQRFSVRLGPPALLRFSISPDNNNLQNVYFERQPIVEVVDLGGNRVSQGMHVLTISLSGGAGRLRGPKQRYTRRGVVRFDRLRIAEPGYNKVLRVQAPGLADGFSATFGVVPNGIPHALSFNSSPKEPVFAGRVFGGNATVRVEVLDIYGLRVTKPASLTLAPFLQGLTHLQLSDVCDVTCRDNSYTIELKASALDAPDNPHLRGDTLTPILIEGSSKLAVEGVAEFSDLKLSLRPQDLSSRVHLRAEIISVRTVTTYDVNGTASSYTENYNVLEASYSAPFGLMRGNIDPSALKLCQFPRNDDDHNAGICQPYVLSPILRAHQGFAGPLVLFFTLNETEVLVVPNSYGNMPFSAAAVVRISAISADGSEVPDDVLTGVTSAASEFARSLPPLRTPRQVVNMAKETQPLFYIDRAGSYRLTVTSLGLASAVTDSILTVVGADVTSLTIDAVPTVPQAYNEPLGGAPPSGSGGRLLSVTLYDQYGNHNTSSGVPITLELSGKARFFDAGWLVTSLLRFTVEGIADFSDAVIAPPTSFHDGGTVVQALLVDGEGPDVGGWGMDRSRVSEMPDSAILELKGIDALGEIVLMNSDLFDNTGCASAGSFDYQAGDYAHPPGSNQPLSHLKYKYVIEGITETPQGPVANLTLLPPIMLSSAQIRQRDREEWPMPSPSRSAGTASVTRRPAPISGSHSLAIGRASPSARRPLVPSSVPPQRSSSQTLIQSSSSPSGRRRGRPRSARSLA